MISKIRQRQGNFASWFELCKRSFQIFTVIFSHFVLNTALESNGLSYDHSREMDDAHEFSENSDENEYPDFYISAVEEDLDNDFDPSLSHFDNQQSENECISPYHIMHVGIRHTETRGIGYQDGYTTLEGFGIYNHNPYLMPFLDIRGHIFNNGKLAGNLGIGGRTVLSSISHLLGLFCYYDIRQENHHLNIVNQISPGIELLGKRMEYRMNGYFPVGKDKGRGYSYKFDRFDGHHILLKNKQKYALTGWDAEAGVHITQSIKYDLFSGVGPYYFTSPHARSWGGKARLLGRYREYVSVEATYSFDSLFKSVFQGTIGISYPFGKKLKRKGKGCPQHNDLMLSRAAFAPYRLEIPVVKKIKRREKAINPATGSPWQVWFVNNTSSSAGTVQSPFPTLLQAQNASAPNDMIYVFPGDGTVTGMDQGIILKNGQKFFGSGVEHLLSTTKGKVIIPQLSSNYPLLMNAGGSAVVLANSNEVSGLHLIPGGAGNFPLILGASGTNGASINNNLFSGGFDYPGIMIQGRGVVLITNNQMTGLVTNTQQAIRLTVDESQSMSGYASNNQISGFWAGIGMNLSLNSSCNYFISNNSLENAGNGSIPIFYGISSAAATNVRVQGGIINNVIKNGTADLLYVGTGTGSGSISGELNISDNTIVNSGNNGININIFGNGNLTCSLNNNYISQSAAGFFGLSAKTNAPGTPILLLNLLNNKNESGYSLINTSGNFYLKNLSENTGILSTITDVVLMK